MQSSDRPRQSQKLRIGILFGGKSAEHEVSLQSAKNIVEALDKDKYVPVLIGIDKSGVWHLNDALSFLINDDNPSLIKLNTNGQTVTLLPGERPNELMATSNAQVAASIDVVFPIIHGPLGEDGTVQGLLRLANLPFVGPDVLGSAIGMDKDVMKRLWRDAGLPVSKFLVFSDASRDSISYKAVTEELGLPCFIKPANMGSSVGVTKVNDQATFDKAIAEAFEFDTKILIEEAVVGDEVECAILGNDQPRASLPGRISLSADFYSYQTKYIDEHGAKLEIPAQLSADVMALVQRTALQAFTVLTCQGLARVDMFLTADNKVVLNEINTLPGFTKVSMYPKLWEASGLGYTDLISQLIDLAIERHQRRSTLKTNYV